MLILTSEITFTADNHKIARYPKIRSLWTRLHTHQSTQVATSDPLEVRISLVQSKNIAFDSVSSYGCKHFQKVLPSDFMSVGLDEMMFVALGLD